LYFLNIFLMFYTYFKQYYKNMLKTFVKQFKQFKTWFLLAFGTFTNLWKLSPPRLLFWSRDLSIRPITLVSWFRINNAPFDLPSRIETIASPLFRVKMEEYRGHVSSRRERMTWLRYHKSTRERFTRVKWYHYE